MLVELLGKTKRCYVFDGQFVGGDDVQVVWEPREERLYVGPRAPLS